MDIIKKRINEIANKRQADIEKQINLCISEIGTICESSLQESIKQADNFEGELLLKQKRLEFIIKSSISKNQPPVNNRIGAILPKALNNFKIKDF